MTAVPTFRYYSHRLVPILDVWAFAFHAFGLYRPSRLGSHLSEWFDVEREAPHDQDGHELERVVPERRHVGHPQQVEPDRVGGHPAGRDQAEVARERKVLEEARVGLQHACRARNSRHRASTYSEKRRLKTGRSNSRARARKASGSKRSAAASKARIAAVSASTDCLRKKKVCGADAFI